MVSVTMHPASGLAFHRKRQTLSCLNTERPKSLQSFYDAMKIAIDGLEVRLRFAEKCYYKDKKTPIEEIKQWMHSINSVLKATRTPGIQAFNQLEQIQFQVKELGQAKALDESLMDLVFESVNKTLNSQDEDFQPIMEEVQRLTEFLGKYCLSFSEGNDDPYMSTVMAYDRQITELQHTIIKNLDGIRSMFKKFQNEGLLFADVRDSTVAEVAYRAECPHVPYLLIFVASCDNIRNALDALHKWLAEDKTYASFIRVDISDIEKQKVGRARRLREVEQKCYQLGFKLKANRKHLTEMYEEFEKLKDKESIFVGEEKLLLEEHREIILDLELKALRKENLKREATRLSSREFNEKNERLIFETSALKERLQVLMRRLDDLRTKTKWLTGKRGLRSEKEAEVTRLKKEQKTAKKEVRSAEFELLRVDTSLSRLKQVLLLKTSPGVLKKIFHSLPFDTKKTLGSNGKPTDPLDKACRIIAKHLEGDWLRFYSCLPFVPPRGDETIKQDLTQLSEQHMRKNLEQQAKHSLSRWRRAHTRATVDDLKATLVHIKRDDVLKRLTLVLAVRPNFPAKVNRQVHFPNMAPREKKIYKFNF